MLLWPSGFRFPPFSGFNSILPFSAFSPTQSDEPRRSLGDLFSDFLLFYFRTFTLYFSCAFPSATLSFPLSAFGFFPSRHSLAFTNLETRHRSPVTLPSPLLELLVVIAIIAILMVLVGPTFTSIKPGSDVTTAAYKIADALEQGVNSYFCRGCDFVFLGCVCGVHTDRD